MIEPEIATQARSLLSTVVAILVEDEHAAIISIPADDAAHAERLHQLGSDITAIAAALEVILRRAERTP